MLARLLFALAVMLAGAGLISLLRRRLGPPPGEGGRGPGDPGPGDAVAGDRAGPPAGAREAELGVATLRWAGVLILIALIAVVSVQAIGAPMAGPR